ADLASAIHAAAIVAYTSSGATAARIARKRPRVPILATTTSVEVSPSSLPLVGRRQRALRGGAKLRGDGQARDRACAAGGVRQRRRYFGGRCRHTVGSGRDNQQSARRFGLLTP